MKSTETNIIGGMFGLELHYFERSAQDIQTPPFLQKPHLLLATARSAFTLLAHELRPKTVWLPSYLCGIVIGAFPAHLMDVRFYPVNERLRITEKEWLSEIRENDLVIFIDYFGFRHWSDWGALARERGAWVVQDASQALLNDNYCQHSHYVIFSPRKFIGVPDGGILLALNGAELPDIKLPSQPALWWMEAARASLLRAEWDRHGGERTWLKIFQETELAGPMKPCRMSDLSRMVLAHAVDWDEVSRRRRVNYSFLATELKAIAVFPDLPNDVVPLGFPVRVKDRDGVREALFEQQIYPPVHWSLEGVVPPKFEASHQLSSEIMTIPCDQRYHKSDMRRVVDQLYREVF